MYGVVIVGTHSGCGKTTVTLGILAALQKKGYAVQPFKTGPDFIDTGIHRLITGKTSRNLDLWMCGGDYVKTCFVKHSTDADVAVVEGVMGMYDGELNSARLAAVLGLPVILIVDAYGMAESAGAVVKGFVEYRAKNKKQRTKTEVAGVIFNRIASDRHYKRLKESVQDVPVLGCLPRDITFEIPHRHLGLLVAEENPISKKEIDKLADVVIEHVDIEKIMQGSEVREQGAVKKEESLSRLTSRPLDTLNPEVKIAIAHDKAFCFYYQDNLDMLKDAGAELVTFSPLSDSKIPDGVDALYLGGGYPELHTEELSRNLSMLESVKRFSDSGKPVYAECGGFMYLTEGIYDFDNNYFSMVAVFPFKTKMTKGRAHLGYRETILREDSMLGGKGDVLRGHEFHYSEIVNSSQQSAGNDLHSDLIYSVKDGSAKHISDEGYKVKNTLGSYIHMHFGSNPAIAKNLINHIKEHHGTDTVSRTRQS